MKYDDDDDDDDDHDDDDDDGGGVHEEEGGETTDLAPVAVADVGRQSQDVDQLHTGQVGGRLSDGGVHAPSPLLETQEKWRPCKRFQSQGHMERKKKAYRCSKFDACCLLSC